MLSTRMEEASRSPSAPRCKQSQGRDRSSLECATVFVGRIRWCRQTCTVAKHLPRRWPGLTLPQSRALVRAIGGAKEMRSRRYACSRNGVDGLQQSAAGVSALGLLPVCMLRVQALSAAPHRVCPAGFCGSRSQFHAHPSCPAPSPPRPPDGGAATPCGAGLAMPRRDAARPLAFESWSPLWAAGWGTAGDGAAAACRRRG